MNGLFFSYVRRISRVITVSSNTVKMCWKIKHVVAGGLKMRIRREVSRLLWCASCALHSDSVVTNLLLFYKGVSLKMNFTLTSALRQCQESQRSIVCSLSESHSNCVAVLYSHCITFTSFPRGIHSPLVGAWARKLRASSFPGSAGIQSSGFTSFSCNTAVTHVC